MLSEAFYPGEKQFLGGTEFEKMWISKKQRQVAIGAAIPKPAINVTCSRYLGRSCAVAEPAKFRDTVLAIARHSMEIGASRGV